MSQESGIGSALKKFIADNYLAGSPESLGDHDSFLKKGIIDSIGVIELTTFVQKTFKIKVEVKEIIPENFDTVHNLESYIQKKLIENM